MIAVPSPSGSGWPLSILVVVVVALGMTASTPVFLPLSLRILVLILVLIIIIITCVAVLRLAVGNLVVWSLMGKTHTQNVQPDYSSVRLLEHTSERAHTATNMHVDLHLRRYGLPTLCSRRHPVREACGCCARQPPNSWERGALHMSMVPP